MSDNSNEWASAQLSIARTTCGDGTSHISLSVVDKNFKSVAELKISPESFGNAVTGLAFQPCSAWVDVTYQKPSCCHNWEECREGWICAECGIVSSFGEEE